MQDIISSFDKIRNHFGVNRVAQAGALEAVKDQPYVESVRANLGDAREKLYQIAKANGAGCAPHPVLSGDTMMRPSPFGRAGLTPLSSATNFVTMDCGRCVL